MLEAPEPELAGKRFAFGEQLMVGRGRDNHIVIPEGEKDATAFLYEQVERLTKGMQTKARPKLKGRTLLDEPNARITLSRKESRIEMVLSIDLKATPDYQTALMNLMYKVNQCFATNQNILVSARS